MKQFKKTPLLLFTALLVSALLAPLLINPGRSEALSGSQFSKGNIIGDSVFFNPNVMNSTQIQIFLDSKVPECDTNGTKSYGGTTRAAYGTSRGYPPPYTCLKSYRQNIPSRSAQTGLCGAIPARNSRTAAQIIDEVARACGVSQRALLVLLQKEQSLVTDDWPWSIQYRSATGFGCPDTAPCDSEYYGFFNQVYSAARQFKRYALNESSYNYRKQRNNYVQYHPNAGCGGSTFYIHNQATAGLYNYTPYQPNQAALNNLYGEGDGCSAYGNRNFWRMYNDWFGSTQAALCNFPSNTDNGVYRLVDLNSNSYFLTISPSEVCSATGRYGYHLDSILFYPDNTGSDPIYRLERNGTYLFTASSSEVSRAQSYGFRVEGVAFYGSNTYDAQNAPLPVYRLNYPQTGAYMYTVSLEEAKMARDKAGYTIEGIAFYTANNTGLETKDIYRLASTYSGWLYTASESERTNAINSYGFRAEGIGFRTKTGYRSTSLPVYRLAAKGGYLFTTSLTERKRAIQLGYRYEGVAYHGFDATGVNGTTPVYRLAHPRGAYLFTTSTTERQRAVQDYGFRYEGIGFKVP